MAEEENENKTCRDEVPDEYCLRLCFEIVEKSVTDLKGV
jgi:hypothetical protein